MSLRNTLLAFTPKGNRERHIERIMSPPKRTLRNDIMGFTWEVKEWWCRHVTQRDLYRQLDNFILVEQRYGLAEALRRLRVEYQNSASDDEGSDNGGA